MNWVPFGADPEDHATLVDGTPPWMEASLRVCFKSEFFREERFDSYGGTRSVKRIDRMRKMELQTRIRPVADRFGEQGIDAVFTIMSPDERLRALDWIIKDNAEHNERGNEDTEIVLRLGGSRWMVGKRNDVAGLEARVPIGVQEAAEAVMVTAGRAGQLLSEAWHSAFGANPDPEDAYEKAIKAVEEAAAQVVSPNNSQATLGTVVRDMKNQGDWALPLNPRDPDLPARMAELLWKGQESRHGGNDYRKPTPDEAEAALLLAVPLVQWFSSGVIARRQSA